ncbi:MAG: magnesium transporter [Phycisphaerae bacterium]|nr:magnesium transporter [Phycisphaerae bacterium]
MEAVVDPHQALQEILGPEIEAMLAAGQTKEVHDSLVHLIEPEIADVLLFLSPHHRAVAFRLLPRDRAAEVFTYLPFETQEALLEQLTSDQMAQLFNAIAPDDRAELFDELPGALVQRVMNLITPENRHITELLLNYPEQSVGRFMTPNYLRLKADWTMQRALDHIRQRGRAAGSLDTLYVTDDRNHLLHEVRLQDVLFAEPTAKIATLSGGMVPSLRATDDQEEAVRAMERYDRPVLPVVEKDNTLVGIVTFDDVADVAEEEVTEDIQKMAAVEALDEPYIDVSIPTLVRKRAVWLGILFFGQMATISALEHFEGHLQKAAVLMLFIPLLISSGGNTGSQAASLIIRALSLGEITIYDWWRVMRREVLCGLSLGALLATFGALRVWAGEWFGWSDYGGYAGLVSLTVAASLLVIVLWGTLVGSMLPIILKRLGLDPASSSTPLVSTLMDVTGIVIYFMTALTLLRGTLL